jgi:hypothetical protein
MRFVTGSFAAICSFVLAACSTPYRPAQVDGEGTFPGLVELARNSASGSTPSPLDVLVVHGMCTNYPEDVQAQINDLRSVLGAGAAAPVALSDVPGTGAGPGRGIQFAQDVVPLGAGKVRITALRWSPLTTEAKKTLCYDPSGEATSRQEGRICNGARLNDYRRASVNSGVRDSILDDCLSDVVFYLGHRRTMIEAMQRAIAYVTANPEPGMARTASDLPSITSAAMKNTAPLVLISESLGSKYVSDSLDDLQHHSSFGLAEHGGVNAEDLAALGTHIAERTSVIYMAANQLPLLALADERRDVVLREHSPTFAPRSNSMEAFTAHKLADGSPVTARTIVAFSDPSDLLSYTLIPWHGLAANAKASDVLVSNDYTWHLAFISVENPWKAHTGYLATPDVRDFLRCGRPNRC